MGYNGRLRLCDRAEADGGGRGGGGGRGIPGSQPDGLGAWLVEREEEPLEPITPVDAALRAEGGFAAAFPCDALDV